MTLVKLGLAVALTIFGSAVAFADTSPFTKLPSLPGGGGTIAVDPTAPEKLYMSVGGGKIARSVDSGASWTVAQVGSYGSSFGGIAVNPKHPNIVLAILDGLELSGSRLVGLHQSTDGGVTWELLAHQPPSGEFGLGGSGVIFNPAGTVIVASDGQGIIRSTDSGNSWSTALFASVSAIAADPNNPQTLWGVGNTPSGVATVWNSTDFGQTWSEKDIPFLNAHEFFRGVAVQPESGNVLVPYWEPGNMSYSGGMALSKDGGKTWTNSSAGLSPAAATFSNPIFASDDSKTVIFPAVGPGYPQDLYRSINSGKNWNAVGSAKGLAGETGIRYLAAQPAGPKNAAEFLAGGTSFFSSADHGISWKRQEVGLNAVGASTIWADGAGGAGLYALGNTSRLFHSTDDGKDWSHADNWAGSADVSAFAVDLRAAGHDAYAATNEASGSTIWRSTDLGVSWTKLTTPLPKQAFVAQLAVDPVASGHVYLAYQVGLPFQAGSIENGLLRSADSGQTWATLSVGTKGDSFYFTPSVIAPDPGATGTLYATMSSGLWKSTDHGTHWVKRKLSTNSAQITGFTIMPGSREILFAALSSPSNDYNVDLRRSIDGGTSWTTVTSPFGAVSPSDEISVLAAPGGRLIAYRNCRTGISGPAGQVVLSTDHGRSWKLVDQPIIPDLDTLSCPTVSVTSHDAYITDPYGSQVTYTAPLDRL